MLWEKLQGPGTLQIFLKPFSHNCKYFCDPDYNNYSDSYSGLSTNVRGEKRGSDRI